jgi:hypothetical protein
VFVFSFLQSSTGEEVCLGQVRSKSGQVRSRSGQVRSGQVRSGHVRSGRRRGLNRGLLVGHVCRRLSSVAAAAAAFGMVKCMALLLLCLPPEGMQFMQ